MDPEWEVYLFICIFQFSFVLTILSPLFWKLFGFIASPGAGVAFFCLFLNIQSPYFNISLCSDFSDTVYSFFFSLQIEIMEWTELLLVHK